MCRCGPHAPQARGCQSKVSGIFLCILLLNCLETGLSQAWKLTSLVRLAGWQALDCACLHLHSEGAWKKIGIVMGSMLVESVHEGHVEFLSKRPFAGDT